LSQELLFLRFTFDFSILTLSLIPRQRFLIDRRQRGTETPVG